MPVTIDKLLGKPLLHKHKDSDISDFTNLDNRYVNTSGDTMTGPLILSRDPIQPMEAATKQYVDNNGGAVQSVNGQTGDVVLTTDDIAEGTNNLYYTDARVSNNPDVVANTAHRSRVDNPHDVTAAQVGALVSISGVDNPGGDVNLVAGNNITITPDNINKTITFSVPDDLTNLSLHTTDELPEGTINRYSRLSDTADGTGVYTMKKLAVGRDAAVHMLDIIGEYNRSAFLVSSKMDKPFGPGDDGKIFQVMNTGTGDNMFFLSVSGPSAGDLGMSMLIQGAGGWLLGVDNSDGDKFKFSSRWNNLAGGAKVTLVPNGYVGIGTTNPAYKLDVTGPVRATAFITSSDIRLKKDVKTLSGVLDKILKIKGVSFKWKKNNKKSIGIIAQDLEKYFPELVYEKDGYKAIDYPKFTAVLLEAIKELYKMVK